MYNLVFGDDGPRDRGQLLLAILGFTKSADVGRYRDSWIEKGPDGEPIVAIYTRNGGGNREHYSYTEPPVPEGPDCHCTGCVGTYNLPAHPLYLRDQDDEFDSTYATFYFRAPEEFRESLRELAIDPVNMSEKWLEAIAAIRGSA